MVYPQRIAIAGLAHSTTDLSVCFRRQPTQRVAERQGSTIETWMVGRPEQISVALNDAKDARRTSFRVLAHHIPLQSKPLESVAVAAAEPAPSVTK